MPLTAVHRERGRLDATALDEAAWNLVHRRGAPLSCPECGARMVAAESTAGLWHFRHYRRPDNCENAGETPTHQELKRLILAAVRSVPGWSADPEVSGDGWRADVLAAGPEDRRIAWEVQVSSIGATTAAERTRRLSASGVAACWLYTAGRRSTLDGLPRVRTSRLPGEWRVTKGAARFSTTFARWQNVELDTARFAQSVCRGHVSWRPDLHGGIWTTDQHAAAAAEEVARRAALGELVPAGPRPGVRGAFVSASRAAKMRQEIEAERARGHRSGLATFSSAGPAAP